MIPTGETLPCVAVSPGMPSDSTANHNFGKLPKGLSPPPVSLLKTAEREQLSDRESLLKVAIAAMAC